MFASEQCQLKQFKNDKKGISETEKIFKAFDKKPETRMRILRNQERKRDYQYPKKQGIFYDCEASNKKRKASKNIRGGKVQQTGYPCSTKFYVKNTLDRRSFMQIRRPINQ